MIKENSVSLWVGVASSVVALEQALAEQFSVDGDSEGSAFSRAFQTGSYNDDFREAESRPLNGDWSCFFKGFSSEEALVSRFSAFYSCPPAGFNCVIILYDFEYKGHVREARLSDLFLQFVGSVDGVSL